MTLEELQAMADKWWFPVITDDAYCDRLREDHEEDVEGMDNESLVDHYNDGLRYQRLWDHIGDAYEQFEPLADAFLAMRKQLIELLSKDH